jgi:hypothetical protein
MDGWHAFDGVYRGPGQEPDLEGRIQLGLWPYKKGAPFLPPPGAPPFASLAPDLQALFRECFESPRPEARPSARRFRLALETTITELVPCRREPKHFYHHSNLHCPFCPRQRAPRRGPAHVAGARPAGRAAALLVPFAPLGRCLGWLAASLASFGWKDWALGTLVLVVLVSVPVSLWPGVFRRGAAAQSPGYRYGPAAGQDEKLPPGLPAPPLWKELKRAR